MLDAVYDAQLEGGISEPGAALELARTIAETSDHEPWGPDPRPYGE